ncbi:hypothetical protein [Lysobacter gummosus]
MRLTARQHTQGFDRYASHLVGQRHRKADRRAARRVARRRP